MSINKINFFYQIKKKKKERKMLSSQHFSQQILNGILLLADVGGEKSKFNGGVKLEPITN